MRLLSFRIQNYKSIVDTGEVSISGHDNITVLAGQNESGKSSILEAINSYESGDFDVDSKPFTTKGNLTQSVSCTYEVTDASGFFNDISTGLREEFETDVSEEDPILDEKKMKAIKTFTLTRSHSTEDGTVSLEVTSSVFEIVKASILQQEVETDETQTDGTVKKVVTKEKIIDISDENLEDVASIFWKYAPKAILFNDFCDLLPDKITLADLKNKTTTVKGYRAVKNLETILGVNFVDLFSKEDLEREAIRDEHNETLSVDFQKAWGQKIHNTNKIEVKYDFEKRDTDDTSYVNFYTETKDRQKLKPHQRSKGLIWFLSFWIELNAQNSNSHQLIILADEPGLYLHVKAQADILKLFKKLATQGHQILYTTHSPNLIEAEKLNRISLVLNDPKQGTILESVTTSKIDSQNKQDALQPVANAIGFSVSDFALSNKRCLLLEGISDYFYYQGMRSLLKRKDDYSLVPGIGVRKQNTLVSFCVGYGIDWVAIFDDDSTRGLDSKKTFDDIKKHLFDGNDKVAETKMHITTGISSVENMFTVEDIKLVDKTITAKADAEKSISEARKVVIAKSFFEKVESGEITLAKLKPATVARFKDVFDWVDLNLGL
jgi:predicted ATP-dependent endonuclease of OLD family